VSLKNKTRPTHEKALGMAWRTGPSSECVAKIRQFLNLGRPSVLSDMIQKR